MMGATSFIRILIALTLLQTNVTSANQTCSLKAVSWNVNGVGKLRTMPPEREFLASFDRILLRETYTLSPELAFELDGFIPHHQMGRYTSRRPSWGLTTLWKIDSIVGGALCRIPSPVDWIVVSRWKWDTDMGLLVANIYLPIHTQGFGPADVDVAIAFFGSLRSDFPADRLLIGGDLNVDPWRICEQRASGEDIPSRVRLVSWSFVQWKSVALSICFFRKLVFDCSFRLLCSLGWPRDFQTLSWAWVWFGTQVHVFSRMWIRTSSRH